MRTDVEILVEQGKLEEAVKLLEQEVRANPADDAPLCELGGVYWKMQDWKNCLDCYTEAIRINPESRAVEMKKMVQNILAFYNKEMYNV